MNRHQRQFTVDIPNPDLGVAGRANRFTPTLTMNVEGAWIEVTDVGALKVLNTDGVLVRAFAPGSWQRVEENEH